MSNSFFDSLDDKLLRHSYVDCVYIPTLGGCTVTRKSLLGRQYKPKQGFSDIYVALQKELNISSDLALPDGKFLSEWLNRNGNWLRLRREANTFAEIHFDGRKDSYLGTNYPAARETFEAIERTIRERSRPQQLALNL